jgi:hypothetical protein
MLSKLISGLLLTVAVAFTIPSVADAAYSDPLPNAACSDGRFVIYLNPQGVSDRVAVRVDNSVNPWGGDTPLPGDFVNNDVRNSAFIINTPEYGRWYHWWIHRVDAAGKYGPAQKGSVLCLIPSPKEATGTYENGQVVLRWQPVSGAVRYAVRWDDRETSPVEFNPSNTKSGDGFNNNITATSFAMPVSGNRLFTLWVHAIDKNGGFSPSSRLQTVRTK